MIFKGEKTFFFRSIFWIVFFINLSLSSFFEANGQDEIIWEKYKIEKSRKDPIDTKLKKQGSIHSFWKDIVFGREENSADFQSLQRSGMFLTNR